MANKFTKENPVHVLSVGTKILLKDVMDQYLRSLGEVKTFYAAKMSTAVESYAEKKPAVVFCEQSFSEGSALDFIDAIGGLDLASDRYFVLATEAPDEPLITLAAETCMDELLVKPFSTVHVHSIMDRYLLKKERTTPWVTDLRAAQRAFQEKRFQEADELYGQTAKSHWDKNQVLLDVADYFLRRQQWAKVIPLVEKILGDAPDQVRALHLQGCAFRKMGRLREAMRSLLRAGELSPMNTLRNGEMAELYLTLGEEQIVQGLKWDGESSALILRRAQ